MSTKTKAGVLVPAAPGTCVTVISFGYGLDEPPTMDAPWIRRVPVIAWEITVDEDRHPRDSSRHGVSPVLAEPEQEHFARFYLEYPDGSLVRPFVDRYPDLAAAKEAAFKEIADEWAIERRLAQKAAEAETAAKQKL